MCKVSVQNLNCVGSETAVLSDSFYLAPKLLPIRASLPVVGTRRHAPQQAGEWAKPPSNPHFIKGQYEKKQNSK